MSSSCMGKELPKEKKWGVKDCRARKCPDLRKTGNYPDDTQERCYALGEDHHSMMPGTLSCCIRDLDNMPPEQFLRHVIWSLRDGWEKKFSGNRKTPGPKNCPASCPYKISEEGKVRDRSNKADFYAMKNGLIWKCAFSGAELGSGLAASCPCHVLDNPDQEKYLRDLQTAVLIYRTHGNAPKYLDIRCSTVMCPDGIHRCKDRKTCPVIKLPLAEMKECPLWRIPAKLLTEVKADPVVSEKPTAPDTIVVPSPEEMTQKEKTPSRKSAQKEKPAADPTPVSPQEMTPEERLARGKVIREEVRENREAMKRMSTGKTDLFPAAKEPAKVPSEDVCRHLHKEGGCNIYTGIQDGVDTDKCDGRNPENWCYVEPVMEKQKRARKERPDPICAACRERMKGNVPAHACEWCKEEQQQKGRRAWVTDIKLGSVLLGDMNEIGKRVPDEAVDVICTDPPYIKELYEQAYADLAALASRVLKPYGFLFTYAPQTHLDEIMDLLRFSTDGRQKEGLRWFWIIESLNEGQSTAKNHQRNAICLHKPILVFQKVPPGENIRGARRCFADVVRGKRQKRYHPWQQSIHDVLGIIDRFMVPGEILLDPFAGTGTSLIAGQLLGMEVVGFEMDPKTHAIAVREMQQRPVDLTGFGIEDTAPDCEREPVPEAKDQSRQAAIPETPAEPDGCLICGHFKGRKTFLESCPRLNDLMFKGGQYSASRLMAETAIEGCSGMIPKTEKKSASRKPKKTKESP